jgi:ribulose-bisphosphate carboxylase large chain
MDQSNRYANQTEGEAADRNIAYMITYDSADWPFYRQDWLGMNPTTPIISGGMNALRMPGFFQNLGRSNLIMTAGGGAFGHIDGGAAGARPLRPAEQCWREGADRSNSPSTIASSLRRSPTGR